MADRDVSGLQPARAAQSARTDAYQFMLAMTESLGTYIGAEENVAQLKPSGNPIRDVTARLAAFRTAEAKCRLAQTIVARFSSKNDPALAGMADSWAFAYGKMAGFYTRKVILMERILRDPKLPAAEVVIEDSKLDSMGDQLTDLFGLATAGIATVIVDASRTDSEGHAVYLKVTTEEKADIIRRMLTLAGPSPEDERADSSRAVERVPAVILWRWLRKDWRGADAR
jgi:hypothetical protein